MQYGRLKYKLLISIKFIILLCITISLYSCGLNDNDKPEVKGFIWEMSKDGKTNTIVGTMHPMPVDYEHLNSDVINKLKKANGIAIQLDITNPEVIAALHKDRQLEADDSIENYLTFEEVKQLEEIIKSYDRDVDIEGIKGLNAKGIHNFIMNLNYLQTGFVSSSNESEIILGAKAKKLPIVELLGVENSVNYINDLFNWDNLKNYIHNYDNIGLENKKEIAGSMFKAYAEGNISVLESIENDIAQKSGFEREYLKLYTSTNNILTENVDKLCNETDNYIYAIDYRHLIGEDNLILSLEKKGYSIKRIN